MFDAARLVVSGILLFLVVANYGIGLEFCMEMQRYSWRWTDRDLKVYQACRRFGEIGFFFTAVRVK